MWPERVEAYQVTVGEQGDLEGVRKSYKKIVNGRWGAPELNDRFCANDTLACVTLEKLLVEDGENRRVDQMNRVPGMGPVESEDGSSSFIILKGVRGPEPKALQEARGQITSDYQNYLESEWINELKQKYPVEVDSTLLSRINP
jgi:peptidyl-prolyl cis-trans isomerase SurA